jgi:hypothetical protein
MMSNEAQPMFQIGNGSSLDAGYLASAKVGTIYATDQY